MSIHQIKGYFYFLLLQYFNINIPIESELIIQFTFTVFTLSLICLICVINILFII
jgi:hypothetical protein